VTIIDAIGRSRPGPSRRSTIGSPRHSSKTFDPQLHIVDARRSKIRPAREAIGDSRTIAGIGALGMSLTGHNADCFNDQRRGQT
jgi:hypothetical protein